MSLLKRMIPSLKAFTPASDINWQRIQTLVHGPGASDTYASGGDSNSAVFACLMTLCTAVTEPPPRVVRNESDGKKTPIPNSPLLQLLVNTPTPNGELTYEEMLFWTNWAKHTDGNAYWVKVRSGHVTRGNVVEVWPVSPVNMRPVTEVDRSGRALEWISRYELQVAPNKWEEVPLENVVHFRLGIDPKDMRKGLSPLKRLARQVSSDEEADKFTNSLLQNYAIPGLVVIPGQGETIDKPTAERISEAMSDKFGGNNRGKTAVISKHGDVKQFGFSPKDLDMNVLHRIPEERIAAVIGVPAILAGLGAGLDRATLANARELREGFTEQKLVPNWRFDAARLNVSLKPDFHSDPAIMLEFDISNVRALQEDQTDKYNRLNAGVQGQRQWISRNEARAEVGFMPMAGYDELEESSVPAATLEPGTASRPVPETKQADRPGRRRALAEGRRGVRLEVAGRMETAVDTFFSDLANDLILELSREEPTITQRGRNGTAVKELTRREFLTIINQLFRQKTDDLDELVKSYVLEVSELTWPYLNLELESVAVFDQNDPAVVAALDEAGLHIKDIMDTTRDALAEYLQEAYRDGRSIDEIGRQVEGLVAETYSGRSRAIARTEIGTAQNTATHGRYQQAGVKHVEVFDNGFDNSHEFCRQVQGKVVTVEWMRRNPLQHPNCVRAFGAVFDYEGDVFTQEQPWN